MTQAHPTGNIPLSSQAPGLGKWFLITGANSGLGFENTKALYAKSAKVLMAVRVLDRGEAAKREILKKPSSNGRLEVIECDLSRFSSIKKCAEEVKAKGYQLAALVNNAGVFLSTHDVSEQGWPLTMAVNHFGPFLLTHLLLDNLLQNAPTRVVNLGSVAEFFTPDDWLELVRKPHKGDREGLYTYGFTKLANIMLAKEYYMRLYHKHGVGAFAAHPGVSRTALLPKTDPAKPESIMMRLCGQVQRTQAASSRRSYLTSCAQERGAKPEIRATTDERLMDKGFAFLGPPRLGPFVWHIRMDGESSTWTAAANDPDACMDLYRETFAMVHKIEPSIRRMPERSMNAEFPRT